MVTVLPNPNGEPHAVLIVGVGLSGSVAAWCLRRLCGPRITIYQRDQARGYGGRLATARIPIGKDQEIRVNMGTRNLHYEKDVRKNITSNFPTECFSGQDVQPYVQNLWESFLKEMREATDESGNMIVDGSSDGVLRLVPTTSSNQFCKVLAKAGCVSSVQFDSRIKEVHAEHYKSQKGYGSYYFLRTTSYEKKGKGGSTKATTPQDPTFPDTFRGMIFAGSVAELFTTSGSSTRAITKVHASSLDPVQHDQKCVLALVLGIDHTMLREMFPDDSTSIKIRDEVMDLEKMTTDQMISDLEIYKDARATINSGSDFGYIVIVITSTPSFVKRECKNLRATHRPSESDISQQNRITAILRDRVLGYVNTVLGRESSTPWNVVAEKLNYWKYAQCISSMQSGGKCIFGGAWNPIAITGDYFGDGTHSLSNIFISALAASAHLHDHLFGKIKPESRIGKIISIPQSTGLPHNNLPVPRFLIVGCGLSGALACHQLRQLCDSSNTKAIIDVMDMARGAGGRMSTTRHGPQDTRGNTGAQYVSCFTDDAIKNLLGTRANHDKSPDIKEIKNPMERETFFHLKPYSEYKHFRIGNGTNSLVKHFLYAGTPDVVSFETRLQSLWVSKSSIVPLFDRARTEEGKSLQNSYDVVIIAMPPKDIMKFFGSNSRKEDHQSQADLHRKFNKGKGHKENASFLAAGMKAAALPTDVQKQLRAVSFVGRYSICLWFDTDAGFKYVSDVASVWQKVRGSSADTGIIDAVFPQSDNRVLVVQSTVDFWYKYSNVHSGGGKGGGKQRGKGNSASGSLDGVTGGGRDAVRMQLIQSMEKLVNGRKMPRVAHVKLLNWRTSQASDTAQMVSNTRNDQPCVLTAENGSIIMTGDWCVESSYEGCFQSAQVAAQSAFDSVRQRIKGPVKNDDEKYGTIDSSPTSFNPPKRTKSEVQNSHGSFYADGPVKTKQTRWKVKK